MMRLAAIIIALWPLAASAEVYDDDLSPEAFGSLEVRIADSAKGGCWTNLGETKTYAEDKLELAGYQIEEGQWRFFSIAVVSGRIGGNCYGAIQIRLERMVKTENLIGLQIIAEDFYIFTGYNNANSLILDRIKAVIDEIQ